MHRDFVTSTFPLWWAAGAAREEPQPMGRTRVGEVHEGSPPVGGLPCWSRGRSPPPEEGVTETICEELIASPIPCLLAQLGEEEEEKIGSEIEPGDKGAEQRRCFKIWGYFSLPYSDLTGSELN